MPIAGLVKRGECGTGLGQQGLEDLPREWRWQGGQGSSVEVLGREVPRRRIPTDPGVEDASDGAVTNLGEVLELDRDRGIPVSLAEDL